MHTLTKPLHDLTAGDLMTSVVVSLPRHLSLAKAANLLAHAQVTGAPVIDEAGACIGVISGSDFIRWARHHRVEDLDEPQGLCVCSDWQLVETDEEEAPHDVVGRYMTPDPIMAHQETTIQELARMMLAAHIHRIIIVDEEDRPIGIVSSTDILVAVAAYPA